MTTPGTTGRSDAGPVSLDAVPELRGDFERRDIAGQAVVWSPIAPRPVAFDSVATVMLDVVDGVASMAELATDVHEAVGIPLETALQQVVRVIEEFDSAGILTSSVLGSTAEAAIASAEIFIGSSTPCSENASRLATEGLSLRFGDKVVRVACDSRRGARKLRDALADHLVHEGEGAEEPPLAFVLTAPQGLKRNHQLTDRSGFTLSSGRRLDPGLRALASHLTALVPPAAGSVRIRARALVADGRTLVCLPPLLYMPPPDDRTLRGDGLCVIDRLALDVEIDTGRMVNPPIPWPSLAELPGTTPHLGVGEPQTISVVVDTAPPGTPPPTPAAIVARLAGNGVDGSPAELLDAAIRIVDGAELRSSAPQTKEVIEALLGARSPGA